MNMRRKRSSAAFFLSLAAHLVIGVFLAFTFILERVKMRETEAPEIVLGGEKKRKPSIRRERPELPKTKMEAAARSGAPYQLLFSSRQDGIGVIQVAPAYGDGGSGEAPEILREPAALRAAPPASQPDPPKFKPMTAKPPEMRPSEAPALLIDSSLPAARLNPPERERPSVERTAGPDLDAGVRTRPPVIKPGRATISGADIRRLPGTAGDALRALRSMPGVSTANDLSGELYIRGGSSEENRYYFDRIVLGYPYHFGGLVSTISNEIIDRIDVHAGGFGAEYGEAQAVIEIAPRRLEKRSAGLKSNLNPLLSEWFLSTPLGADGTAYLAGRRSYYDLILPKILNIDTITAFPRFWDYQTGAEIDLSPTQFLRVTAFGSQDFMQLLLKDEDVTEDPELVGDLRYKYSFAGRGATLETRLENGGVLDTTLAQNLFAFDFTIGQGFFLKISQNMWTLREDLVYPLNDAHLIEAGAEMYAGTSSVSSFFARPPDEGSEAPDFADAEKIRAESTLPMTWLSAYLKDTAKLSETVKATVGARIQRYNITRDVNLDPRLSLSYAPSDESSLRLAWGLYSQSPEPYHVLEPWGNSDLKSRRAVHFIAEAERQIGDSLSVKAAAYQKRQSGLVISDPIDIYVNKGTGLARGVELFAKYNLSDKFLGWFSYAYGRSTRRDDPEEEERLFSFDQTHVATVAAVLAPSPKWEIGFKWHYATGLPYTPVVDANLAIDGAGGFYYEPAFGPTNSARLPYYSRLDVRASRNWTLAGAEIGGYLEILNALYRRNVLDISYNDDYSAEEKVYQLPIIPFIGLSMRF